MRKLMFVCTGNTCRSPMAEYILKDLLKKEGIEDVKVTSSGLSAAENGVMNPNAKTALKNLGITVRKFQSKKADGELCRKQDAVICMTNAQKRYFVGFKNIFSIDELTALGDIADPYGGDEKIYALCAENIRKACEKIVELLKK